MSENAQTPLETFAYQQLQALQELTSKHPFLAAYISPDVYEKILSILIDEDVDEFFTNVSFQSHPFNGNRTMDVIAHASSPFTTTKKRE